MVYSESKNCRFMSEITTADIEKLAVLARVGLTEAEKKSLAGEMTAILEYVKQLDEVNVGGVDPTSQVTGLTGTSRKDGIVRSDIGRDELLSNAPETENGFIKVKSVL